MELTPDMLLDAAEILAIDHSGPRLEFMCRALFDAVKELHGYDAAREAEQTFWDLLRAHDVDIAGSLSDERGRALITRFDDRPKAEAQFAVQCVRFDFLHLLAHSLET